MARGISIKKILIVIVVIVVAYLGYKHFFGGVNPGMPQGGAPQVSVAQVLEKNVRLWGEYSGRLVAADQVEVRPRVSGTIETVHFKESALVKKGDLLFTIDLRPYRASFNSAQALATAAENEYKRASRLYAEKAISQREFDASKSAVEVARANLATAKLNMDFAEIKSPIDGRVSRAEVTVGNLVDAGGNAPLLTTIVSIDPIYADFDIDERAYLNYAQYNSAHQVKDIPVSMSLVGEQGSPHKGKIKSFDNKLNIGSGSIRVRAVFDNKDGKLVPGLFARVRLGAAKEVPAILITDRAVGTDQNKKFVLVVGEDNKVEHREVKLGASVDGLRVVESGLKPGEKIVVNGLQRARPGTPVTPEIVDMEKADAPPAAPAPEGKAEEKKSEDKAKPEGEAK